MLSELKEFEAYFVTVPMTLAAVESAQPVLGPLQRVLSVP